MTDDRQILYKVLYRSGLFIPVEKQSLFMVAFEDMLVSSFNVVPLFGPADKTNLCEVKFNYLGNKSYKPQSLVFDLEKAAAYLRSNMSVLWPKKRLRKSKRSQGFQTSPKVINLEDESEVTILDLTDVDRGEPEVIVLDDSFVNSVRETKQNSSRISVVDLTDISESSTTTQNRKETQNDIQILSMNITKPQFPHFTNTPASKIEKSISLNTPVQNRKQKHQNNSKKREKVNGRSPAGSTSSTSGRSGYLSSTEVLPKKKIKLQDISNIDSTASCSTSPSFSKSSNLSASTRWYYEFISKVVGKTEENKNKISTRKDFKLRNRSANIAQSKKESLPKQVSPIRGHFKISKKRVTYTPLKSATGIGLWNQPRKFIQRSQSALNSPRSLRQIRGKEKRCSLREIEEINTFNPNPQEVDLEGLRPIVIDGCNVAIGHGKGTFSPKGLKICVDYFAARGHNKVKVFLPQFRQEEFSAEMLEDLRSKCDVLFTPSHSINGHRRTSYDDRFIVQYATEFGGVIVSTDNYRDLSRENPKWQDTIERRLLMFTWVDDFLMFPVDPLGRSGPTLEDFLRF